MERGSERILDEYLVLLAQGGSRPALDLLVRRWTPRLLRHATRLLGASEPARDTVQEIWAGALRSLRGLSDPAQFPAWIYAIATRKCADAVRRAVRRRRSEEAAVTDRALNAPPPDSMARAGDGLDLSDALRRLPVDQRIVIDMFYLDDLGVEEIAAALGIPAGTVKSRLHHARQVLKTHLEGEHHDPH